MADKKNYYDVLGVSKTATDDEIKSAYRKKVKEYHPDLHPGDKEAAEKFKEINEANETLSDKQKRAAYDYELEHPGMGGMGGGFSGFGGGGGFGGFEDIFSSFFGGGMGGGARPEDNVGEDIKKTMTLSFMDAAKGCTKQFSYMRNRPCRGDCRGTGAKNGTAYSQCPKCGGQGKIRMTQNTMFGRTVRIAACPDCGGTGKKILEKCPVCKGKCYTREEEKLTVKIPAGADNDSYIVKRGFGHASATGGASGDLYIVFSVEPHKIFTRKGMDLYVDLPVSYAKAALGGNVRVPDLDDSFVYTLPEGTQSGTRFAIRGKGISSSRGTGNLYVTVNVEVPTKLTKEQRAALEKILADTDVKQYPKVKKYSDNMESLYGKKPY